MNKPRQNQAIVWKRRLTQVIALLFMLYAFAEVSVLQAYCGNESIGIPPAHHLAGQSNSIRDKNEMPAETTLSDTSYPENEEEQGPSCSNECLGSCTHVTVGSFIIEPGIFTYIRENTNSFSYENKYSNSNLSYLFRPPRTA